MLRQARNGDLAQIDSLWRAPRNAPFLPVPDPDELDEALAEGMLFVWEHEDRIAGFARLVVWSADDGIMGLKAMAMARPGQGDGQRFLAALLEHVFVACHAHRLGLDCVPDNAAGLRLWQGAGFVPEGRFRECWRRPDGTYTDSLIFALLAREWLASRAPPPAP